VPPIHNSNNVKKCLREVPGVTGAVFEFYCDTNERIRKKKTTAAAAVAVRPTIRRIRTVPDGTEGEKNANCVTKTQQHNTDRLALETTAVRMRRLAWSWSKLNNTTTTKSRLDLPWEDFHCNVHVFNCMAACVDVGGHQL
jgi:2-polyprenyl-6-methoxyphenol hydroxylase-like FAD-dependent oxidoreductase